MQVPERDKHITLLYHEGVPVKDIAKHVAMTRPGLYIVLERLGLDIRNPDRIEATKAYKKAHPRLKRDCIFPGCPRTGKGNHGYCEGHRNQYKKKGKVTQIQVRSEKPCKAPGCTRTARSFGYCLQDRVKFIGKFPYQLKSKKCIYKPEPCENKSFSRGYCTRHYRLLKDAGMLVTVPFKRYPEKCSLPRCSRDHYSRGFCRKDYSRLLHQGVLPRIRPKELYLEASEELTKVG